MAHRAHESSGKEKNMYKEEETRARPRALIRSLARSFVRSLASERTNEYTIHTGGKRTERASAHVHYDSCIYIRSKNIRALCAGGPRPVFHLRIIF